ncbi:MAG: DoxX family protein [Cyclobacteriaceae bacterium]
MTTISLYLMALLYMIAGIMHFLYPKVYFKIIPPFFKHKKWINWISGAAEIILAIGLVIPATRSLAAWGIIALLIAVFPANVYHLQLGGAGMKIPKWILWLRLPFQGLLIYWAYLYT